MARRYITDKDHVGLQRMAKSFKAGKGIFSKRPVPTRRRPSPGGTGTAGPDFPRIIIRNTSGVVLQSRSIVGIGAPLVLPPEEHLVLPLFDSIPPIPWRDFAVTLGGVANGDLIEAVPVGIVSVTLDYQGQEYEHELKGHRFAIPINNNYTRMASAEMGPATIIRREKQAVLGTGTKGIQWAFVRLDNYLPPSDQWGVVSTEITASTGVRGGPITPGKGKVQLYVPPSPTLYLAAGTPWQPGPVVDCENWMRKSEEVGKMIRVEPSRLLNTGAILYRTTAEGCEAIPTS